MVERRDAWLWTAIIAAAAVVATILIGGLLGWQRGGATVTPPAVTITTTTTATVTAYPAATLAEQVAVLFSQVTGWPHQELYAEILGFTSVGTTVIARTGLTEPADYTELCSLVGQFNDPVLDVGPIDELLVTGTDGTVIWSCIPGSEVL